MSARATHGSLSSAQRRVVSEMVAALSEVPGIVALALGGSHASGRALPSSDVDLGLLYSQREPFSLDALRAIARRFDSTTVVTAPYEWGPWANGGAWLTVGAQRFDWIYRNTDQIEQVIEAAEHGDYESHTEQMPPFGFFGPTYLGELRIAVALHDADGRLAALQSRVVDYPEALRSAIVDAQLWGVEFGLSAFASKFAAGGDVYLTAGALTRFSHQLVLALYALNGEYPVNDKSAMLDVARFERAPARFCQRIESVLANVGRSPEELVARVDEFDALFREVIELAGDLYRPRQLP